MDPTLKLPELNVPALLRAYQLHPKKGLGQNFLVDESALLRVVEAAEIQPESTVLEIGPGLGSLTRYLARAARRVVAVELDQALLAPLEHVLRGAGDVSVVAGDMLEIDPGSLVEEPGYLVVANIPYYITSALFRHLLEARVKPSRLVLTVQREVAERICARPDDMSLLALGIQVYGAARVAAQIPAGAFYPVPDVDSAVVRVDLYPEPLIPSAQLELFFRLARSGFGQKRKMLRKSLAAGMAAPVSAVVAKLEQAGIDPQRRAETLAIDEWARLTAGWPGATSGSSPA